MIVDDKDLAYTGAEGIPSAKEGDVTRKTGSWRTFKPVVHRELCISCNFCWANCPDTAITLDENGVPIIDYDVCKGCMICKQVCPKEGAITEERDTHSQA